MTETGNSIKLRLAGKLQLGCFILTTVISLAGWFALGSEYSIVHNTLTCALVLVAAIIISTIVAKSTSKQIENVIYELDATASEVSQSAGAITSSTYKLAEGTNEQSAAVQETSATMEETASIVRQTAGNTKEAVALAEHAKEEANSGVDSVDKLLEAMGKLARSSEEVQKIIKVIDDMAFQTNILSLNAAVEAARAGDAGKGFAVVAEEVRNLAQRSAQAAQETATLIDGNVGLTKTSVKVSEQVGSELKRIDLSVSKVKELLNEVATASQEQVIATAQISQALAQIDQVVQTQTGVTQNNANSAALLDEYCKKLQSIKVELTSMITDSASAYSSPVRTKKQVHTPYIAPKKLTAGPSERRQASSPKIEEELSGAMAVNPEDVIPLDDF